MLRLYSHLCEYTQEEKLEWRHLFHRGAPKSSKNKKTILRTFPLVRNFHLKVAANFLEHSFGAFIEKVSPFMPTSFSWRNFLANYLCIGFAPGIKSRAYEGSEVVSFEEATVCANKDQLTPSTRQRMVWGWRKSSFPEDFGVAKSFQNYARQSSGNFCP